MNLGFLQDRHGDKSSTRLTILQLTGCVIALTLAVCVVAFRGGEYASPIITAISGPLLGLGATIVGAISQRNKGVANATQ